MNNITLQSFEVDLQHGEAVEQEVLRWIQRKYPHAEKIPGNHKQFDIYIPEIKKTVEVKHDMKSDETGNLFIECSFNGAPSGINATTADWWIIVDAECYYLIPTDSLRYLLRNCPKYSYTGRDGTRVQGYLLRKNRLYFSPYASVRNRRK